MTKLEKANEFIQKNKATVSAAFRPNYHFCSQIGWINDPNGLVFYQGRYHVFYQYNPYDSKWDTIHWGHAVSDDLVHWEYLPVALAPDMPYDQDGCFSGSAIVKDDKLYIVYTGQRNTPQGVVETQNVAWSEDGIHFTKYENNPVLSEKDLPPHANIAEFRDPAVWQYREKYFISVGNQSREGEKRFGQLLIFQSEDLLHWKFESFALKGGEKDGIMWECPQLLFFDRYDLFYCSPIGYSPDGDKYHNHNSVVYFTGKYDREKNTFTDEFRDEIDYGFDFFAPQSLVTPKDRKILFAWFQDCTRLQPTHAKGLKWACIWTIPRELSMDADGVLIQTPVQELQVLRRDEVKVKEYALNGKDVAIQGIDGNCTELDIYADLTNSDRFGIKFFVNERCDVELFYKKDEGKLVLDRRRNGENLGGPHFVPAFNGIRKMPVALEKNVLHLRIFIDRISLEIFAEKGRKTMSTTAYPDDDATGIEFSSAGTALLNITKWSLRS